MFVNQGKTLCSPCRTTEWDLSRKESQEITQFFWEFVSALQGSQESATGSCRRLHEWCSHLRNKFFLLFNIVLRTKPGWSNFGLHFKLSYDCQKRGPSDSPSL